MADIKKPARRGKKGTPPKMDETSQNLAKPSTTEQAPLNFKVDAEFKKQYKLYALEHGISMVDLLKASFEAYKQ
ncbi:hypothetical protein CLV84_4295 [Neolewinella xylanilytica]|uniref:ParG protein n=1 Tax=Neolewinella xylanilytica TaxID=1514080 RepID=A0A2S6HZR4_9BACT|nr:hypothetical protein [Neolewinella xylanilytica]PPK83923.1 hypothetical protein CLV84_4295 [Neolewinella xylanilytica]